MKIAAIAFNLLLLAFVVLVMMEEGPSKETSYVVFGFLLVVIPILNIILVALRPGWKDRLPGGSKETPTPTTDGDRSRRASVMNIIGIALNCVLLAFTFWAIADQYPHPDESGVLMFELVAIVTPIFSALVIAKSGAIRKSMKTQGVTVS